MPAFLSDRQFYLCLLLGPLAWLGMAQLLPVRADLNPLHIAALSWLAAVLVYPVLEELVFRGLLFDWLARQAWQRRLGPLSTANLFSALAFAIAHGLYHPWLWATLVFFPGLVFGYMKERSQGLTVPILLHAFYNLGYLWLFAG